MERLAINFSPKSDKHVKPEGEYSKMASTPYNTLGIQIPLDFYQKNIHANWADIAFAEENAILTYRDVIAFAYSELDTESDEDVFTLACMKFEQYCFREDVTPVLHRLSQKETDTTRFEAKKKNMFLLLKWVYENREKYPKPLEVVAFIYDDFGFPQEINKFVYWVPADEPLPPSKELCEQQMMTRWHEYLLQASKKWNR